MAIASGLEAIASRLEAMAMASIEKKKKQLSPSIRTQINSPFVRGRGGGEDQLGSACRGEVVQRPKHLLLLQERRDMGGHGNIWKYLESYFLLGPFTSLYVLPSSLKFEHRTVKGWVTECFCRR